MIDIPLRERQISQVLGFLDEQLGDSDVTIVFGDAADGRAYFVSNAPAVRGDMRADVETGLSFSGDFGRLFLPDYKESIPFHDDVTLCHETAHGILGRNKEELGSYPCNVLVPHDNKLIVLEEASAHLVSMDYNSRFHPETSQHVDMGKDGIEYSCHEDAFSLLLNQEQTLRWLQRRIREANRRKALI